MLARGDLFARGLNSAALGLNYPKFVYKDRCATNDH